jgi:hypothetical protein
MLSRGAPAGQLRRDWPRYLKVRPGSTETPFPVQGLERGFLLTAGCAVGFPQR